MNMNCEKTSLKGKSVNRVFKILPELLIKNDQPCFHYSLEWRYNLVLTLAVIEDDVDIVVVIDAAIVGVDDDEKPLLLHVPLLWLHWRMLL